MKKLPLQELVRQRLQTLVGDKRVPHEVLATFLGLSRSAVTRLLNDEGSGIGLQHIERLCEFFQLTPCELMHSPSSLIQEVKPLEAQLLQHFRDMSELQRHSLISVLDRRTEDIVKRPRRARLGYAELTSEQQLLVDLFARVKRDGVRDGVLKTLRGAAEADEQPAQGKPRTTG